MKEKIICIEWMDACSNSGNYDENRPELFAQMRTRTVGHLIKSTPQDIIVSQDRFYTDKNKIDGDRHISTVPKKMIRQVTYLVERTIPSKGDD